MEFALFEAMANCNMDDMKLWLIRQTIDLQQDSIEFEEL